MKNNRVAAPGLPGDDANNWLPALAIVAPLALPIVELPVAGVVAAGGLLAFGAYKAYEAITK